MSEAVVVTEANNAIHPVTASVIQGALEGDSSS